MFNLFPDLLNYSFFAPLILRLGLGVVLIINGLKNYNGLTADKLDQTLNLISLVAGFLILLGAQTQISAIVLVIVTLFNKSAWQNKVLIITIALSLLLSGAGAHAIDWPL